MASFVIDVVPTARGCTIIADLLSMTFPVIRADFSPEATATQHPVELGAAVSDHVQVQPDRFSVEAFVSDSPRSTSLSQIRVSDAKAFLQQAFGQLLTVLVDGEGTFDGYVLEGWAHSKTGTEGRSFLLRFKQIKIATALSVPIPPGVPSPVAAAGAVTESPLGQQATTTGALPVSALKDIKDSASALSPIAFVSSLLGF